jgi:hypothetical protein
MKTFGSVSGSVSGSRRPLLGVGPLVLVGSLLAAGLLLGCGDTEKTRVLPPVQVAMDMTTDPVFMEGDDCDNGGCIYEVKKGVAFPIIAPSANDMAALGQEATAPYGREPWITLDEVRVQVSWTLSNLDNEQRVVELLVDPWNEFGRYWPGFTLVDAENGEYLPNLSGIDYYYVLEPASAGDASRRTGTYTYDDMDELARDFATVQNLIQNPPTTLPGGNTLDDGASVLPSYVNHAFDFQNHSENDALVGSYVPQVIAGLTGVDFGIRSAEHATVALEIVVEVTDLGHHKVRDDGEKDALLEPTQTIVTVGVSP